MMSATEILRSDHGQIRRFERIVARCYTALYDGVDVPLSDVEKITVVISEFLDSIHYSREEDSYFPCAGVSGDFASRIRKFLIEHQFGRNIAIQISRHLQRWREGGDSREPVARFLRTYSIYLRDHLEKEDQFFDEVEDILDAREEREMFEYFQAVVATSRRIDAVMREMDALESADWYVSGTDTG